MCSCECMPCECNAHRKGIKVPETEVTCTHYSQMPAQKHTYMNTYKNGTQNK